MVALLYLCEGSSAVSGKDLSSSTTSGGIKVLAMESMRCREICTDLCAKNLRRLFLSPDQEMVEFNKLIRHNNILEELDM
mmetsp:Transcript_18316/g.40401  ORF Transcript_18316/g.40401 Transcript_18316/m.40401 type:complete len:80 (+) Transcript_18316:105-344(+)